MNRLQSLVFGRENHIGRRLTVLIIAFSSLVTLGISITQLAMEYRGLRAAMHQQLEGIRIYVPNIAGSVWDFDEKQIQRALNALTLLPNVLQVKVTAFGTNRTWSTGSVAAHNVLTQAYTLHHEREGKTEAIGTLTVAASLDAIYRQVAASAVSILLSNGLKTLLVALFMVFLIRRLITSRLEKMARKVKALPGLDDQRLTAQGAPQPIPKGLDELDAVDWSLDTTATHLGIAVKALQHANETLKNQVASTDAILQNALVGIVMLQDQKILVCNRRCEELFGYAQDEMSGLFAGTLCQSEDDFNDLRRNAHDHFKQGLSFSTVLMLLRRDGSSFWGEISGRALDPAQPTGQSIWIYTDISERKLAEERISHIAYHDSLTELPNRLMLEEHFRRAMLDADQAKTKIALLFLDLDNFKTINDSLGHSTGDKLIREVAMRLAGCLGGTDTICRQGGDEFLIVLPALKDTNAMAPVLLKLATSLLDPFAIEDNELITSTSIGISIYPDDGADFDTLTKKADMAMYRAKDAGRNTYRFFDAQMDVDAVEHLNISNGLRRALERKEFILHYQPQFDLTSKTLIGAEALIRWNHPEQGMIPPNRFIPVAEDNGLIVPMGEWVLREACRQAADWQRSGYEKLVVAVNLSALQFKRGDLEQSVISALEDSGLDPALLELELTESILIHDTETVLATVKRLKLLGIKLSIDDFGTGYSSLSYLKRFEVDKLKIDQSFVRNLESHPEDIAIVHAIIQMAHSLGLTTIAEGVETESVGECLKLMKCDEVQGYFYARPMSVEAFKKHISANISTLAARDQQ